jgi:hypothetical protein
MLRRALGATMGSADLAFTWYSKAMRPAQDRFFKDGYGDIAELRKQQAKWMAAWTQGQLGDVLCCKLHMCRWAWETDFMVALPPCEVRSCQEDIVIDHGTFLSPMADALPKESQRARVMIVRGQQSGSHNFPPTRGFVIHMAATGDEEYTSRKTKLAEPLLAHGIASIILMVPYYGTRRPEGQSKQYIRTVAEYQLQSLCCILEGCALVQWAKQTWPTMAAAYESSPCSPSLLSPLSLKTNIAPHHSNDTLASTPKRQLRATSSSSSSSTPTTISSDRPILLGVTGISWGGAMAACTSVVCREPVACIPCLGSDSPSVMVTGKRRTTLTMLTTLTLLTMLTLLTTLTLLTMLTMRTMLTTLTILTYSLRFHHQMVTGIINLQLDSHHLSHTHLLLSPHPLSSTLNRHHQLAVGLGRPTQAAAKVAAATTASKWHNGARCWCWHWRWRCCCPWSWRERRHGRKLGDE